MKETLEEPATRLTPCRNCGAQPAWVKAEAPSFVLKCRGCGKGVSGITRFSALGQWAKNNHSWLFTHRASNSTAGAEGLDTSGATDSPAAPVTAKDITAAAIGHMNDRAKKYDAPGGERSIAKTVEAFNALTGQDLTVEQGWLFMLALKMARSQQGEYSADTYEDMVAYAALLGEAAGAERNGGGENA